MQFIRHMFRRRCNELKTAGWSMIGFIMMFCVLTVQLSATEGQSSRRTSAPKVSPSQPKPQAFHGLSQSVTLDSISADVFDEKKLTVDPSAFRARKSSPASRISSERVASRTSETAFQQPAMNPFHATMTNASAYQYELTHGDIAGEATYVEPYLVPQSNYFGVDPNECCDEWSGFCGCNEKPLGRWCRDCDNKRSRR